MRILVDGMDLSGKSTLTCGLVDALRADGWVVCRSVGGLHKGVCHRIAAWAYRRLPAGSVWVSWAFVAVVVADILRARRGREGECVVHEAYAAHTVAFARGFGHRGPAAVLLALRPLWPRFDLVVSLRASLRTRRARYAERPGNDAIDAMIWSAPARFAAIDRALGVLLRADGGLELYTDALRPEQVLGVVLGRLRRGRFGAAPDGLYGRSPHSSRMSAAIAPRSVS